MELAVHQFVLGLREAVVIWLALLVLAVLALGCLHLPDRRRRQRVTAADAPAASDARIVADAGASAEATAKGTESGSTGARRGLPAASHPGPVTAPATPAAHGRRRWAEEGGRLVPLRRNAFVAQAEDLDRYAGEVAVAAGRAVVTAHRRWEELIAAQRTRDAAWRAYEATEAAARRVIKAAAFPAPAAPNTPAEYAARERYLHRAATEAYRRGELSAEQLTDALSHRNGWDPRRHPFDLEVMVRRAAQDRLLAAYQAASALERAAWRTMETASAARRCLDDEAYAAAVRARRAHARLVTAGRPSRWRLRAARRPSLATR